MAQINNSEPTHPIIVFHVNLNTGGGIGALQPTQFQSSPDLGRLNEANLASTRSTFIPGLQAGTNRELRDGQNFTLYGSKAQYYRDQIAKGNFPMLSIVSST